MNSLPILLLGANGQVGRALHQELGATPHLEVTSAQLDLSRPETVYSYLEKAKPSLVINAAAYTKVDDAETEEDSAFQINAHSPGEIARYCAQQGVPLIHYSTDYVFDGSGETAWTEKDATHPLSVYGRSKLAGEKKILLAHPSAIILRTSWVFSRWPKNFLLTMLELGKTRPALRVIGDQWGSPTYAIDLARATLQIARSDSFLNGSARGVFHIHNEGETHWHSFASTIFDAYRNSKHQQSAPLAVNEVALIRTEDYPTKAVRPKNSRLNIERLKATFGIEPPHWKDAVTRCVQSLTFTP